MLCLIPTSRSGSATTDSTGSHQTVTALLPHEAAACEKKNELRTFSGCQETWHHTPESGNFQNKPVHLNECRWRRETRRGYLIKNLWLSCFWKETVQNLQPWFYRPVQKSLPSLTWTRIIRNSRSQLQKYIIHHVLQAKHVTSALWKIKKQPLTSQWWTSCFGVQYLCDFYEDVCALKC